MVWTRSPSLWNGDLPVDIEVTYTVNTLIGNLWTHLGSPAGPKSVQITVDGATIGDVDVTADWTGGSTFTFICINGGRIVGLGGNGGAGGPDYGSTGEAGSPGTDGTRAISSDGFQIDLDIDDGYLFGGGGGGGGGSFTDNGATGTPGGGGGGGQGYSATAGGTAGLANGFPPSDDGDGGSIGGPGIHGDGGLGVEPSSNGGDGGVWGSGGQAGNSSDLLFGAGFAFLYYGGLGGRGGQAFEPVNTGTLNLNGAKSEATLRSEGRIKGETDADAVNLPGFLQNEPVDVGSITAGFRFDSDGDLTETSNVGGGDVENTVYWIDGTTVSIGDRYQVRIRNTASSDDQSGTWGTQPAVQGTWSSLSANRLWDFTSVSDDGIAALFEIRRDDVPGNPDTEIIDSFYGRVFNNH